MGHLVCRKSLSAWPALVFMALFSPTVTFKGEKQQLEIHLLSQANLTQIDESKEKKKIENRKKDIRLPLLPASCSAHDIFICALPFLSSSQSDHLKKKNYSAIG